MDITSITFNYSKGEISSVRVSLDLESEDSILISSKFITELRKHLDVSEEDKELFFILARAIQLKKENMKGKSGGLVKEYDFGNKYEPFHEILVTKLMDLAKHVHLDIIALYFDEDAKIEDLDIFLNRKNSYELALIMKDGLPLEDFYEEDDYD